MSYMHQGNHTHKTARLHKVEPRTIVDHLMYQVTTDTPSSMIELDSG